MVGFKALSARHAPCNHALPGTYVAVVDGNTLGTGVLDCQSATESRSCGWLGLSRSASAIVATVAAAAENGWMVQT